MPQTQPVKPPPEGPGRSDDAGLIRHPDGRHRCWWCGTDPAYRDYHDHEWAQPVRDPQALFEKLVLEGFQAGLSWLTILRRRSAFRHAFAAFDPRLVADFTAGDVDRLANDATIIRHRAKIEAAINNARIVTTFPTDQAFADWLWSFAPLVRRSRPAVREDIPTLTEESTELAHSLRTLGWQFIGPTSAYAFMQSIGMVDDHLQGCWVPSAHAP